MIATFFSGLILLFLIFGAYAIDAAAEWNRERRRTLRSREVSRPTPARVTRSLPRSEGPAHTSRSLGGTDRGGSTRRPARSHTGPSTSPHPRHFYGGPWL